MATFIRTLAGKLYLGMLLGAVLCELLTVRALRAIGFSADAAQHGDLIITQAAIFVLAGGLLWLCALLLRRSPVAAAVALLCSIGVELFFFGNLGVAPNLALTALCFLGIGAAVWAGHRSGAPSGPLSPARGEGTRTGGEVAARPARGRVTATGAAEATIPARAAGTETGALMPASMARGGRRSARPPGGAASSPNGAEPGGSVGMGGAADQRAQ